MSFRVFASVSVKCRITEVKNPAEELTVHIVFTWVVGYFANAQYDVLILRHSERSEESHRVSRRHILFTLIVGYFANAQYDALIFHFAFFISTAEYAINFYKNFSYRR